MDQLTEQIEILEQEKQMLEKQLIENSDDYELIVKTTERMGFLIKELNEKSDRWLELSEFV